jgi:hypothetical protein
MKSMMKKRAVDDVPSTVILCSHTSRIDIFGWQIIITPPHDFRKT